MIQPWRARASARSFDDLFADLADGARHQQFVGRAEVGAPPDSGLRRAGPERAVAVEHHHGAAVEPVGRQPPAGGDQHRLADVVERDAMSGRQRLDRGDAGDDVVVDLDALSHRIQDPQRAVVQRRVAPCQKGADAVGREFAFDGVGPHRRARRMPVGDGLPVARRPSPAAGRPVRRTGSPARAMNRSQICRRSATRSLFASPLSIAKNTCVSLSARRPPPSHSRGRLRRYR